MNVYLVKAVDELPNYYDGGDSFWDSQISEIYSWKSIAMKRAGELVREAWEDVDEDGNYKGGHELLHVIVVEFLLNSKDKAKLISETVIGEES